MKRAWFAVLVAVLAVAALSAGPTPGPMVGINIVLKVAPDPATLAQLRTYGKVRDVIPEINGVTLQAPESQLPVIQALPFVEAAGLDQQRTGAPVDLVAATDFAGGMNTWNLDAVNVTNYGAGRSTDWDGTGVYVAVLDTGLLNSWRAYFPQERIAEEYAVSFGGGGGDMGFVSSQPNKWQQDQNSHGTHVTSTILGYNLNGVAVNGVAPLATVIPVKVLNQNGSGWSSVIARGITYIADLKAGDLAASPVVINMSLGGSRLDPLEKAAIDYAISQGVIVVAAAGNEGTRGMGYPGAYAPVISVAASGWIKQGTKSNWWYGLDVADPTNPADFFIASFSSRAKSGQDLDVTAPGASVVGPYQVNGQLSYYYLSGTSMATPHVTGIVALMLQKNGSLTAAQAEAILEATAIPMAAGTWGTITWGADATGAGLATADAALAGTPDGN